MKASEFVKEFGIDTFCLSVGFVSTRKYLVVYEDEIDFTDEIKPSHGECVFDRSEVKRLVESHELVESFKCKRYSGISNARDHLLTLAHIEDHAALNRLRKAIADVESCK